MQNTTPTPIKKVILRKGGAIAKPKPAPNLPKPTTTFTNPRFKNAAGRSFYLFPVMGSHECR